MTIKTKVASVSLCYESHRFNTRNIIMLSASATQEASYVYMPIRYQPKIMYKI